MEATVEGAGVRSASRPAAPTRRPCHRPALVATPESSVSRTPGLAFSQMLYQTPSTMAAAVLRQSISSGVLILRISCHYQAEVHQVLDAGVGEGLPGRCRRKALKPIFSFRSPRLLSSSWMSAANCRASSLAASMPQAAVSQARAGRHSVIHGAWSGIWWEMAAVLVHDRIVVGEEQGVAAHGVVEPLEAP